MSWDRATAAKALANELANAPLVNPLSTSAPATIFEQPPGTVNPPAIVIGWPIEVNFSVIAPGIDQATLPVACVGPFDGSDLVAELVANVRAGVVDSTLGGAVQICYPTAERNWGQINVAGTDLFRAEVIFTIQM
jgi:hypothetical protein